MAFASYNEMLGLGGHSVPTTLKTHCPLQETSGTSIENRATGVAATLTGHVPTADAGPNAWLPNALVSNGTSNSHVLLASPVNSVSNRTYIGYLYGAGNGGFVGGQWSTGGAKVDSTTLVLSRNGEKASPGSSFPKNQWNQVAIRHDGTNAYFNINGTKYTVSSVTTETANLYALGCYNQNGAQTLYNGGKMAGWALFNTSIDDADVTEYFAGPEPIRVAHPTLTAGASTWSASVTPYVLTAPLAADARGTITYEWELRKTSDDSVVQSGTGSSPNGNSPAAGTYYLWIRASNLGGYDSLQDGESSDVVFSAAEISSAVINSAGDTLTITGSATLANSSGFTISGVAAVTGTYSSGSGTASLVFSLSRVVEKNEHPLLNYTAGDVTIGGSPLATIDGLVIDNQSTIDTVAPEFESAVLSDAGLAVTFSELVNNYTGLVLTSDAGISTPLTYSSGDGTPNLFFTTGRVTGSFETFTLSYVAGDIVDGNSNALQAFSGEAVSNTSTATTVWDEVEHDISGVLLFIRATNGDYVTFHGDGATGNLSVNLGAGAFNIPADYVSVRTGRKYVTVVIPEGNRETSVSSVTVSASEGWLKTSSGVDMPALTQTLTAGNVEKETIPAATPRLIDFQVNTPREMGYYSASWYWSNIARHMDFGWRTGGYGGARVAETPLGLPAVASSTLTLAVDAQVGGLPDGNYIVMWDGDTAVTFTEISGNTQLVSDTTDGTKRYREYEWKTTPGRNLNLSCSGDCSSITNFVLCRKSDWNAATKDVTQTLSPEAVERFKNFTSFRHAWQSEIPNAVAASHITNAEYLSYRGKIVNVVATITNVEDYTLEAAYYTDGDFWDKRNSYNSGSTAGLGTVLKITHDGTNTFYTGGRVEFTGVSGTVGGLSINKSWRITNFPIYVPSGATTYFYAHMKDADGSSEYSLGTTGTATAETMFGPSPEATAELINGLIDAGGRMKELWLNIGHNMSAARHAAFAARLSAALDPSVKVLLEWSNEWTFNGAYPYSMAYYYARFMANLGITGIDSMYDTCAAGISEAYDEFASAFGAERVEAMVMHWGSDTIAHSEIMDSGVLTCPITRIGLTNYFADTPLYLSDEITDTLTSSALCALISIYITESHEVSWARIADFAAARGVRVDCYEGGSHATIGTSWSITYTTGWTNASGNRWTRSESRRIADLYVSGSGGSYALVADAATCESTTNSLFWDSSTDTLHVNLGGTDPNTLTILALRFDRKGIALRYMNFHPRFANVFNYMIDRCIDRGIQPSQCSSTTPPSNIPSPYETYMWGLYNWFETPAGDGSANLTYIDEVYAGTRDDRTLFPLIESPRGYEINRWIDPTLYVPTIVSVTRNEADTQTTVVFSRAVESGADGWSGFTVNSIAQTYSSGTGTTTVVFTSSAVGAGTVTAAYSQPGDGIKDLDGTVLESDSDIPVTNNTTGIVTPTITTDTISAKTATTATSGGNVTADGGATVTARGVCWSTSASPTTSDSTTSDGTGTGTFTSSLTGLSESTLYYVRAYATNSAGTAYGNEISFLSDSSTSTIVNETFASDAGGFSAGSRVASEGADFATGYLSVPASTTATRSFTAISSGVFRTDIYTKITDTDTVGATTADSFFYLLPTAGIVTSSNSITTLNFKRETGFGGTANSVGLTVRNNSGFVDTVSVFARQTWIKLSVVADFTAKTFDVLVNDIMVSKSVAWANASAADFSRVVCYNQSAGPQLYDNLLIQDSYSYPVESTLIDHNFVGGSGEIEASTPTTDNRSSEPQLWKIADDTSTYGAFTLGANGATPDASKPCLALQRCAVDGILEVEWNTSVAGTVYFGMLFRAWDYLTPSNGGAGILRIYGGASNTYSLLLPNRAGTLITAATGAFTPSANTTYTLAIEMRGRVLIGKIKAAAIGDGSYTTLFTHTVVSSATGGRGMLAEELCGPFADNTIGATDNYVRRVKFTGRTRADEAVKTIGPCTYQLSHGSIGEIYLDSASSPDKNLFWSRGIQVGHRSTADTNGDVRSNTLINTTNCYSVRQKGTNSTEYEVLGGSDCYYTLLRRGPWVSDNVSVAVNSENFAPDLDLRGELWDKSWYSCTDSGVATSRSDASFHNWTAVNSSIALPAGNQSLSDYSSGDELLLSQVVVPVTNGTGSVWDINHKYEGNLDPISRAISRGSGTLTAGGTDYRVARGFLAEPASALSATRLTDWRDDLAAPTGWTIGTGTLKTDAAGDTNTDGFNERHGWLEITSSGDAIDITNGSTKRLKPCFRVYGLSDTALEVAIDASTLVLNTDYWVDDLGDGSYLLQLNDDVLASEQITATVAVGGVTPTVTTDVASDITTSTATAGGNVTSAGSAAVTARGVCWSTTPAPTIADSTTSDGTGVGAFTSSLTGLTDGTTYYVRAYATNSEGTAYGNEVEFTTVPILVPSVVTSEVSSVGKSTAVCGGSISSDGGGSVTAYGVCWSTSADPTIGDEKTIDGSGVDDFVSNISGLTPNTTYYVRAYATNSAGTGYGDQETFTTVEATAPTISTVTVASDATTITAVFSEAVQAGAGGWSGFTVDGKALTYSSGSGTDTIVFVIIGTGVSYGTVTAAYTQPGNGIQDLNANVLATFADEPVTNNVPDPTPPTVTTATPTSETSSGATVGGNVTADGGATVTSRGVYWALTSNPTSGDNVETAGAGGTGSYTVSITGVDPETTVYVVAWATNSAGTATGSEVEFTTLAEGEDESGAQVIVLIVNYFR